MQYTAIERLDPQTKLSSNDQSDKGNNYAIETDKFLEKYYNNDNHLFQDFRMQMRNHLFKMVAHKPILLKLHPGQNS